MFAQLHADSVSASPAIDSEGVHPQPAPSLTTATSMGSPARVTRGTRSSLTGGTVHAPASGRAASAPPSNRAPSGCEASGCDASSAAPSVCEASVCEASGCEASGCEASDRAPSPAASPSGFTDEAHPADNKTSANQERASMALR
jgi:hypothetical protein